LNIEAVLYNMDLAKNFLAHEIQHIISFNQKELKNNIYEDIWLNELRSEYATTVAGYNDDYNTSNLIKRVGTFLDNQSDSLTEWPNVPKDYAQVALFGEYLVEQYGADILTETLRSNLFGINSINQFLSDRGHQERFKDIFIDWMIALYINDSGFDSRYGYIRDGLKSLKMNKSENFRRVFPTITSYFDFVSIKDWQPIWLEYDVQPLSSDMRKSIRLDIDGPRGKESIASYIVFYDDRAPEVFNIPILNNSGTAYILNSSGTMNKILVVATSTNKIMDFSSIEPPRSLSVRLSIIDSEIVKANTLKDGSLIKRTDGDEIYVIRGNYKRYLTPETINLYGHISSDDAISVPLSIFNSYKTSNYVKYIDDEKVYAIWPDGTKHWFNMTEDQFLGSNRKVDAIYIINELELNSYKSGVDIIK
jgi:hypothetical protein